MNLKRTFITLVVPLLLLPVICSCNFIISLVYYPWTVTPTPDPGPDPGPTPPEPVGYEGLKFTSLENGSKVSYKITQFLHEASVEIQYSLDDGETWKDWTYTEAVPPDIDSPSDETITLDAGESVCVRNNKETLSCLNSDSGYSDAFTFVVDGKIEASGNINSMINNAPIYEYCFCSLFEECSDLISAPELPATVLDKKCYMRMFDNCTSLTSAPELPATTLADNCYYQMFEYCTSLTSAPELPAGKDGVGTLATSCYEEMFRFSGITSAPELPATTLTESCYASMFGNCDSLVYAQTELPAMTLENECYSMMFNDCSSLVSAPFLPASTLADSCYYQMFDGCSSLYVKVDDSTNATKIFDCTDTTSYNSPTFLMFGSIATTVADPTDTHSYYWYVFDPDATYDVTFNFYWAHQTNCDISSKLYLVENASSSTPITSTTITTDGKMDFYLWKDNTIADTDVPNCLPSNFPSANPAWWTSYSTNWGIYPFNGSFLTWICYVPNDSATGMDSNHLHVVVQIPEHHNLRPVTSNLDLAISVEWADMLY